jgi:phage tail-like protein
MTPPEFRRQLLRTPAHWAHGVGFRLETLDDGGVALFSCPAFAGWATQAASARGAESFALDACGRLFWIRQQDDVLYRLDPASGFIEPMIPLAGEDDASVQPSESSSRSGRFGRMLHVADRIWIHDRQRSRLIVLRPDTFQILADVALSGSIDIAAGGGRLFALDREGLHAYDETGRPLGPPRALQLSQPLALGADPRGQWLYIIDAAARGFLRFAPDGTFHDVLGSFDDVGRGFAPAQLTVHPAGPLFVSDGSAVAHEFSTDGGYIGNTGTVSPITGISAMTCDARGQLYLASPQGIARLGREAGIAGNAGVFYTGTLDNGSDDPGGWHRLDLLTTLDSGGAVDVFYATHDDPALANLVADIFARDTGAASKTTALESVLGDRWQGPQELRAPATPTANTSPLAERPSYSVLFRADTGRYLWIKLVLSGLAPRAAASVREMRIYYPRLSYLRYLPAVYQADRTSRDFLERFLSLFETVFSGLEATIEQLPGLFEASRTPPEFLDWLAQWVNLGVEEGWPDSVKRRLLLAAPRLFAQKGTPAGLADFIEIIVGRRPVIRESFDTDRPLVLGDGIRLGLGAPLASQPVEPLPRERRTILGGGARLGATALRGETTRPVNPYRAAAHRFIVALDLSPRQFQRYATGLHRVIREHSPAHLDYDIRLLSGSGLGANTIVGINHRVEDPQPWRLGYSALGRAICAGRVRYGPEVGRDSVVAGSIDEARRAGARPCGER